MSRPHRKPQAGAQPPQSGLTVVQNGQAEPSTKQSAKPAQDKTDSDQARAQDVAARKRLHPARVWPD